MATLKLSFQKAKFNFLLPKILEFINTLDGDKDYELVIGKAKEKRSNDANAYFWTLINKLSGKINIPPVEIYRTYIKDVGGNYEVIPIREDAVETWIKVWQGRGLGWLCDIIGESKLRGYMNVICYYGSSTYDTRQMTRLIDLCVQDCKENNIETLTPEELARMVEQ